MEDKCRDEGEPWQIAYVHKTIKKRKLTNTSPIRIKKKIIKTATSSNKTGNLPIDKPTENRYAILDNEGDQMDISNTPNNDDTGKIFKPPPIFIPGIRKISEFIKTLSDAIGKDNFTYKSNRDGQIKLNATNSDAFRTVVKLLDSNKAIYHTYQLKEDKTCKIVIKNLHHSTDVSFITEESIKFGHKCRNIVNVKTIRMHLILRAYAMPWSKSSHLINSTT